MGNNLEVNGGLFQFPFHSDHHGRGRRNLLRPPHSDNHPPTWLFLRTCPYRCFHCLFFLCGLKISPSLFWNPYALLFKRGKGLLRGSLRKYLFLPDSPVGWKILPLSRYGPFHFSHTPVHCFSYLPSHRLGRQ
jgi:hypothetical protein